MANRHGAHALRSTDFRFSISFTVMFLIVGLLAIPAGAGLVPVTVSVVDDFGVPIDGVTVRFVADGVETFEITDGSGAVVVELDDTVPTEISIGDPRFHPYAESWDGRSDVFITLSPFRVILNVAIGAISPEPPPVPWFVHVIPENSFDPPYFAEIYPGYVATFDVPVGLVILDAHRDTASTEATFVSEIWIDGTETVVDAFFPINDVTVIGTVVSSTGAPIENVQVLGDVWWEFQDPFGPIGVPFTDLYVDANTAVDGSFSIDALAGWGFLNFSAPGFDPVDVEVNLDSALGHVVDLGEITLELSGDMTTGTGSASTDNDGVPGASASDPLETSVTSPNGAAEITIDESTATGIPPSGYGFVGQQIDITVTPDATPEDPLSFVFTLDASQVPPGEDETTLQVTRNGVIVADCTQTVPSIIPDPCISDRELLVEGDVQITVLTSAASIWNIVQSFNNPPTVEMAAPVEGDLFQVGEAIQPEVTVTDDLGDTVDCSVSWGDGLIGSCEEPHSYSSAGVYTVTATATDSFGESATDAVMVVVYDPDGGFVTGGGWIDSQPGAYMLGGASGKATFGFVSRYKKGVDVPDGETEFVFSAGDFRFHSTAYEWLVVAGDTAQFKGTGTVNGYDGFRFKLWATDGPDKFRIKVWSELDDGTEVVVYDNGAQQAIGGGNIVVHSG